MLLDQLPPGLEIIRHFNSYTEVSPSGTGRHIWIKKKLPPGAPRQSKVEM
jgi:primase-polymerase (primpol)-like protein